MTWIHSSTTATHSRWPESTAILLQHNPDDLNPQQYYCNTTQMTWIHSNTTATHSSWPESTATPLQHNPDDLNPQQYYCNTFQMTWIHSNTTATYSRWPESTAILIPEPQVSQFKAFIYQTTLLNKCLHQFLYRKCHVTSGFQLSPDNLTFRGPCIVIYSYNKSQQDALFVILVMLTVC